MKVEITGLDEAIKKQLEDFNINAVTAANVSFKEVAKEAAKMLKQGGTYEEKTGEYSKNWTAGQRNRTKSVVTVGGYTVYNKERYQLTHLLEFGHQSRNGGRVKAFSHIATVNEQIGEMIVDKIRWKLGG